MTAVTSPSMVTWAHTLNLADVFHNDNLTFRERRDAIAHRIQRAGWFNYSDMDLMDVVDFLADATDAAEFDEAWVMFYDWADSARIWVATR